MYCVLSCPTEQCHGKLRRNFSSLHDVENIQLSCISSWETGFVCLFCLSLLKVQLFSSVKTCLNTPQFYSHPDGRIAKEMKILCCIQTYLKPGSFHPQIFISVLGFTFERKLRLELQASINRNSSKCSTVRKSSEPWIVIYVTINQSIFTQN